MDAQEWLGQASYREWGHAYYLPCLFHLKVSTLINPLYRYYCKKKKSC